MAGSSDDEETGRFVDEESQNNHDASTKGSKLSRRAENALPDKQVRRKKWQRQGSDDGDGELEEKEASLPRKGSKNDSAEDEAASGSPDHSSQIRKKSGSRVTSRTTVTDNKHKSPSKFTKDTATSEEDEEKLQRPRGSSSTSSSKYRKKVSLSTDDDEAHAVSDQRASNKHADLGKGKKEPVSKQDSSDKRAAFASRGKANTIATSTVVHSKKSVTLKERSGSIEATTKSRSESEGSDSSPRRISHGASPRKVSFGVRKASSDRPPWSPSTKVDHKPVHNQTLINRRASAGNELDDSKKHAAQIRARWENKSFDDGESHGSGYVRPKAFGGSTAASALKARFENKGDASKKRASVDVEDGKTVLSASGMRARFEQNAEEPASVKRNFVISKGRPGGGKKFMPAVSNKCQACEKTVYPVEKLEADGHVFHKFCFRCTTCNRTLGVGNYAALEGKVYCKPHLKQLFKLKGNYDEGFGRQTHKTLWLQKDGAVGGALAPAGDDDNTGDEGERDPSHENGHALKVVDSQDDGHSGSDNDE